LTDIISKQPRS